MRRVLLLVGSVVGLSLLMLLVGAVAGKAPATAPAAEAGLPTDGVQLTRQAVGADVAANIVTLQDRLKTVPQDWSAWATLGGLYTTQARLTADPSYYAKADGAFTQSLTIQPDDNAAAVSGQATLAASRHDFAGALALTQQAERLNAYSAPNLGIMVDALTELGRYPEALTTLQRMVDLKPGVASFTRVSYSYELRGDTAGAKQALDRTLEVAQSPGDRAFALQYLGELAFNGGDLDTAERQFTLGLQQDPSYMPLLAGKARVEAARGAVDQAVQDWQIVTTRLPQPTYLIEYADLLTSLGRTADAAAQYALVDATAALFRAQGANVDLELALFDADHGRPAPALAAAQAQLDVRRSILVEDAYAWALHVNGRDQEALAHAQAADHLGMKNALFAYHRGEIERALGNHAAAAQWLQKSLDINPYFSPLLAPRAKQALEATRNGS